jgi:hypothetical protein
VIFPDVNIELRLEKEMLKERAGGNLPLSKRGLDWILVSNLNCLCDLAIATFGELLQLEY